MYSPCCVASQILSIGILRFLPDSNAETGEVEARTQAPQICTDDPKLDRRAFHRDFNSEVVAFFNKTLLRSAYRSDCEVDSWIMSYAEVIPVNLTPLLHKVDCDRFSGNTSEFSLTLALARAGRAPPLQPSA